jgi:hypothetical protein
MTPGLQELRVLESEVGQVPPEPLGAAKHIIGVVGLRGNRFIS